MELLTLAQIADVFGVSIRTIQRWIKDGDFPQGTRYGRRGLRWRVETIQAFIERKEPQDSWRQS